MRLIATRGTQLRCASMHLYLHTLTHLVFLSSSRADPDAMDNAPAAGPGETPLTAFLVKQLEKYNVLVTETHQKIYGDLSTLKDTMVENIDKVR